MDLTSAAARLLVDPLLAVVFPSACPACGRLLAHPRRGPLCEPCWAGLPRHRALACGCVLSLPPGRSACGRCRLKRQPFSSGASLGPYEGSLRIVVHELKYAGRRRAAGRLAEALLEDPAVRVLVETSDVLVPVPLHPRRLRERGFNQAALLAAEVAQRAARPACADALVRRLDTRTQEGLSAEDRVLQVLYLYRTSASRQIRYRFSAVVSSVRGDHKRRACF